jgi:hypothetical protein
MAISTQKAKALCTAAEYALVRASSPQQRAKLTPAQMSQKVDRARALRDKYRDLAKQQRGEARGKRSPTGTRAAKGNERTVEKAQLFAETLERFQEGLAEAKRESAAGAKADKSTKKTSPRAKKAGKTAKKPAAKASATGRSEASKPRASAGAASTGGSASRMPEAIVPLPNVQADLTAPLPVGGPASPLSSVSIGGEPIGVNPLAGFGKGGAAQHASRDQRRREKSRNAKLGREQSRFAATGREQIQGHTSAQTRRAQARRDAKS